jgi:hypothetical protein
MRARKVADELSVRVCFRPEADLHVAMRCPYFVEDAALTGRS